MTPGGGHRIPAEHRFLGLDRRSFPYAVSALLVWVLWAVVVPAVDEAVPWADPIRAGDTIRLSDTVTFTPTVGWNLQEGLRTTDSTASGATSTGGAVLVSGGVRLQIRTGPWAGTPAELLRQITKITTTVSAGQGFQIDGGTSTIQARTGETGVLETFSSPRAAGVIAAFVLDDTGFQVQAVGPAEQLGAHAGDIRDMITSISHQPEQP
jgi:hypothetical protein